MKFEDDFIPYEGAAFLNAGTLSKTPRIALKAMSESRNFLEENPTKSFLESYKLLWRIHERLASFIQANPKDIYLRNNISAALNDFIFGLEFDSSIGEVLVSDLEYGATANMAELKARRLGYFFHKFEIPVRSDVSREEILDSFQRKLTDKTRMVVISHVATGTGLVLPIEEMAKKAKEVGAVVIVDGAHSVGALSLDFRKFQNIDFYGGNLHKWFMGPRGTAFGWVNANTKAKIAWPFGGWASFQAPAFYGEFAEKDEEACRRLFSGTIDPSPWIGLDKVFDYWQSHGENSIRKVLYNKRELVFQEMQKRNWTAVSSSSQERQSPLVTFLLPPKWMKYTSYDLATRIYNDLKIQIAIPEIKGEKYLRITAGIYVSDQSILTAAEALSNY
ncbi:MAG: aminotransferase class V-fold PLP-dependent enzyme [Oligoflexia bacterium]|nr:aminotransferase class V-fold PLP-dependent enzyme [Oligoflexia bacterium]